MFVILGASGHVGGAAVAHLLEAGAHVLAVVHDEEKAAGLRAQGAETAGVDVGDANALRQVLRRGSRAFLLNPPAPVSGDVDAEERRTARGIVAALDGSGLEKVVAASTYGAQPGAHCGDLGSLHAFEAALTAQPIPVAINRGAFYFSNWDAMLAPAREGKLPTMLPADLKVPMVAPKDLGRAAARRLCEPADVVGLHHVEGPQRYSAADVARAFADALGREVKVEVTPRERWAEVYENQGFSPEAARSYANMTRVTMDGDFPDPATTERGTVSLEAYVRALVARS